MGGVFKNTGITELVFGKEVKHIFGDYYSGCIELHSIVIPNSVEEVHSSAFFCHNFHRITIGQNVKEIGRAAFYTSNMCAKDLEIINCLSVVPPKLWTSDSFSSFDESTLSHATLRVPAEAIGTYKTADGWKDFFNIQGVENLAKLVEKDEEIEKIKKNIDLLIQERVSISSVSNYLGGLVSVAGVVKARIKYEKDKVSAVSFPFPDTSYADVSFKKGEELIGLNFNEYFTSSWEDDTYCFDYACSYDVEKDAGFVFLRVGGKDMKTRQEVIFIRNNKLYEIPKGIKKAIITNFLRTK